MFTFDARSVAPWVGYELVQPGWTKVAIRKSNFKPNQAQNGSYLELQLEILEGPAKGKTVTDRLNTQNPSVEAVDIAYRKLAAICYCVGVMQISAVQQPDAVVAAMHGIPFFAEITIQKSARGTDMNAIASYKDINGNDPGKGSGAMAPTMQPPPPPPSPVQPGVPNMAQQWPQQPGVVPPGVPSAAPPGMAPQGQPAPQQWQQQPAPAPMAQPAPATQQWPQQVPPGAAPQGQPAPASQQWPQQAAQQQQPGAPGAAPPWVNAPR